MLGATYTSLESGSAITSGGPGYAMGGGRGNSIFTFTCAIAGIGTASAKVTNIVPKNSFFILLPPEFQMLPLLDHTP